MGFFPHPGLKKLLLSRCQLEPRVHKDNSPTVHWFLVVEIDRVWPILRGSWWWWLRRIAFYRPVRLWHTQLRPIRRGSRGLLDRRSRLVRGNRDKARQIRAASAEEDSKNGPWEPHIQGVHPQYNRHIAGSTTTKKSWDCPRGRQQTQAVTASIGQCRLFSLLRRGRATPIARKTCLVIFDESFLAAGRKNPG